MKKITPFLWYDAQAEEAINLYISVFKNSKVITMNRYPDSVPGMGGKVMQAVFELDGQQFCAFDAGPMYKFTEAISMFVECEDQAEVDEYWGKLTSGGGQESQCGWLKDKFGLSWQIVPKRLGQLLSDPDKDRAGRALQAMMKMKKIVVAELEAAADQK